LGGIARIGSWKSPGRKAVRSGRETTRDHSCSCHNLAVSADWEPLATGFFESRVRKAILGQTPSQNHLWPVHFLRAPPGLGSGELTRNGREESPLRPEPGPTRATCRGDVAATLEAMFPPGSRDRP